IGIGHQFGTLLQPDLGFAARHEDTDAPIRPTGSAPGFRFDLFGYAEPFEDAFDMRGGDAAAGANEIDARADNLAIADQAVDCGAIGEEDVDRLAALKARNERAGRAI